MGSFSKRICITGDITKDFFLFRGNRFYSNDLDENKAGTNFVNQKGGAYLIYNFLKTISDLRKGSDENNQLSVEFSYNEKVFENLPDKNKRYASVNQFIKDKKKVWRIEDFLGFGNISEEVIKLAEYKSAVSSGPDIFIINDAGMDFSDSGNKEIKSKFIQDNVYAKKAGRELLTICLKSGEIDKSSLLGDLLKASDGKQINLMTILSVNDIRRLDVKISAGLSWEQSASDLVYELETNDVLNNLLKSKYLLITFQSSGALIVTNRGNNKFEYTLIFDPEKMEGEDIENGKGKISGCMSVFTATFAANLDLEKINKPSAIENAVKKALTSVRLFYDIGYKQPSEENIYPFKEVAEALCTVKEICFSAASVPNYSTISSDHQPEWSILVDNYSDRKKKEGVELKALTSLAKSIVINGPRILKNVPAGKFGSIFTVDRDEIESLRNLKKILETYIRFDKGKKPLSLAVFGPPGAGKSFAVEQIGKGIMGEMYELLCFNLSQFSGTDDIIGALHQVRDKVLMNKTPLVFWDEFDSKNYFWLQYLLAPMQDGAFHEGQITHPVGKCIFVFAGGTSYNMAAFGRFNNIESEKDFALKKGPDFISRLNGYINILGPNRRQLYNPGYTKEEDKWIDDPADICYPVRRALFIINLLHLKDSDFPVKMDWGLLNALIKVDRYKHGSRSLANLLSDIRQNNPGNQLLRSWLPSKPTMELYFKNTDSFYHYLIREDDYREMIWEIAPIIHSFWLGKIKDPLNQNSIEYSILPAFVKASNVMAAKRIPEVLETGGFMITAINSPDKIEETEYVSLINKNNKAVLEKMSEKEHELWMEFYIENGWEYAKIRNDYDKKHDCIVKYDQLPEEQKNKDRDFVLNFPVIVRKAGFVIARK